ncbi:MAG: DEAD/DEAH box helicase family protein [Spirochaetales bacterium]|nr:DEAD/DEAH box helicase family protein [Spirochaetales bacterium]
MLNQNPEQIARDKIDRILSLAGWIIQSKDEIDLSAGKGVAIREYQTDAGPADYVLFVDRKPVGVIEAKREEEGVRLTIVEDQSAEYAKAKLKHLDNDPLPFVYESTGLVTRFTDYRDPKPRSRNVFSFHKPETIAEWLRKGKSLRERFCDIPALDPEGLRDAQIRAIENLEKSFKNNRPKALIQMATGAGKTFTAVTFIYRLLKFADAKRILFLVDTRNLGEQAEQEFMTYEPTDDNRKFTELYNVQRLSSGNVASDSQVCISTIQRLYSILKGEELDQSAEEESLEENSWLKQQYKKKDPMPVEYSPSIPIEQFDFIVIDECHRSIYNLWKQILDYFDAFLIGLTATPDKRTFAFFNQNVVSQYTYEESVIDNVNVPHEVYTIETEVTKKGAKVEKGWYVDRRDKLTREKRWQQEDEDTEYYSNDLDKKVVNISQIRTIIREFRRALERDIFPNRRDKKDNEYEVPKTLVFAKTDSHADDIIQIIREEFDEGNEFCRKVTYKIDDDPKSVINRFRNDYYPRIAVTVDMIATGTDIKPLEVLLFMRDVKSRNYFEQMKGRGTRTIDSDSFQRVTRNARHKTHFVIVDAVGAVKSKETDSRPLERKPSVPLKDLLGAVTMGVAEEDLFLSLANRLIRLDKQLTDKERSNMLEYSGGKDLKHITRELLAAYDPDVLHSKIAEKTASLKYEERTKEKLEQIEKEARRELIDEASSTFNGRLNDYIDNVRKIHEQIIDHLNIDGVTRSEWDASSLENAESVVNGFSEYLEKHKDEIQALSIFYNQPYNRREITFRMIKEVMEKIRMDKPAFSPENVWNAWDAVDSARSGNQGQRSMPKSDLTILVSLIRRACGIDNELKAYDSTIDENFRKWIFEQNAGKHNRFTAEQMEWLRMIKDHVVSSYHIGLEDLDYTPFDAQGGKGRMQQLFGKDMEKIIAELNEVLAA